MSTLKLKERLNLYCLHLDFDYGFILNTGSHLLDQNLSWLGFHLDQNY